MHVPKSDKTPIAWQRRCHAKFYFVNPGKTAVLPVLTLKVALKHGLVSYRLYNYQLYNEGLLAVILVVKSLRIACYSH